MKLTWLGQGGYLIEAAGQRLAVDPYLTDALAQQQGLRRLVPAPISIDDLAPDAVFVTHDHLDHFDPETLGPLMRHAPSALLLGPQSVVDHGRQLGIDDPRLLLASVGEAMRWSVFTLTPTPARHSDPWAVGLLIEAGSRPVYISGDTLYDPTLGPSIRSLAGRTLDAAFVCINGRLGNMNATAAAELVAELQPRIAVPMHYGMFAENTADPNDFVVACLARGQKVHLLDIGESVEL